MKPVFTGPAEPARRPCEFKTAAEVIMPIPSHVGRGLRIMTRMTNRSSMLFCLAVALIAATVALPRASATEATLSASATRAPAAVVALRGEINQFNQRMFERHFKQALGTGAQTVVIDIDTYGGLVSAGL